MPCYTQGMNQEPLQNQHASSMSYAVHYRPNAANHYVIRNSIGVAIWVALNVILTTYLTEQWGFGRAGWIAVILAIPALISFVAIFTLRKRYSTDNRLAIGVTDTGLALPGRGVIAWDDIVGVRKGGFGIATGNIRIYLFEMWAGTRETHSIQVFVKGGTAELDALSKDPNSNQELANVLGARATRNEPLKGFRISTAYIQGLGEADYKQAAETVLAAAMSRGIPTKF